MVETYRLMDPSSGYVTERDDCQYIDVVRKSNYESIAALLTRMLPQVDAHSELARECRAILGAEAPTSVQPSLAEICNSGLNPIKPPYTMRRPGKS
jgi:hypothetical protein